MFAWTGQAFTALTAADATALDTRIRFSAVARTDLAEYVDRISAASGYKRVVDNHLIYARGDGLMLDSNYRVVLEHQEDKSQKLVLKNQHREQVVAEIADGRTLRTPTID